MAYYVTTTVTCDFCPATFTGKQYQKRELREALYDASYAGWGRQMRKGELRDVCPGCKATQWIEQLK